MVQCLVRYKEVHISSQGPKAWSLSNLSWLSEVTPVTFLCGRFPRECQGDSVWLLYSCILYYFVVIDFKSWSVLDMDMPMNVPPQSHWSYPLLPLRFSCRPTKVRQVKSCLELKLVRSKCDVNIFVVWVYARIQSLVVFVAAWCPRVASLAAFVY